jgi:multiphosphoryl transfer protein
MLPMITNVAEVRWVRKIMTEEMARLNSGRIPFDPTIAMGGMIEVPAAAFAIRDLAGELDFFSIGSNDLVHYFTASDRSGSGSASLAQPISPAFLRLLRMIVDEVRSCERWVGLCGEMGADPRMLPLLAGLGLNEVSVATPAIPLIQLEKEKLNYDECRRWLEQSIRSATPEEVGALLNHQVAHFSPALIEPELVIVSSDAGTKAEAIKELCDCLYVAGRTDDPRLIEKAVWTQEGESPSGLGRGFAIPNCHSSAVETNSLVVSKLREPIEWGSSDAQSIRTVILLVVRELDAATAHVKILSRLTRQLMQEDFGRALTATNDADAIVAMLNAEPGVAETSRS